MHRINNASHKPGLRTGLKLLNVLALVAGSLGLLVQAQTQTAAQDYPRGQVKFVVGFPPGGSSDIVTRLLAQKFQDRWGKPVVVEQKVGATGLIANDYVVKSAPDGLNMVLLTGGQIGRAHV